MKTKVLTNDHEKLIAGLRKASEVVVSTLGASGNFVLVGNDDSSLRFTKDGVSVARSITLEDPIENLGAQTVINSANKTVNEVGDGTTTTSLLLLTLVNFIEEHKSEISKNVNEFLNDTEEALELLIKKVKENSISDITLENIRDIAAVAGSSDEIGEILFQIYSTVGKDSLVELNPETSEVSQKTYYNITKGLDMNSGMINSKFRNVSNGNCVFEDPLIYVSSKKITDLDEYLDMMEKAHKDQDPLVIIAPAFSENFIKLALYNKINAKVKICLIKAPGYGEGVAEGLKDIKAFCDEDGYVDKIIVTPRSFTLFNETPFAVEERVSELENKMDAAEDLFYIQDYEKRIHKLRCSTALIFAGGVTEKNAKEEYDRIEDALGSVKSAIRGGYNIGGGNAIFLLKDQIKSSNDLVTKLIKDLCSKPLSVIVNNGFENSEEVLAETKENKHFNIKTRKWEDFNTSGIIDSTEVIEQSIRNSWASAKLLLKTKYLIFNSNSML